MSSKVSPWTSAAKHKRQTGDFGLTATTTGRSTPPPSFTSSSCPPTSNLLQHVSRPSQSGLAGFRSKTRRTVVVTSTAQDQHFNLCSGARRHPTCTCVGHLSPTTPQPTHTIMIKDTLLISEILRSALSKQNHFLNCAKVKVKIFQCVFGSCRTCEELAKLLLQLHGPVKGLLGLVLSQSLIYVPALRIKEQSNAESMT